MRTYKQAYRHSPAAAPARRRQKYSRQLFDTLEQRVLLTAVFGAPTGQSALPEPLQVAAGDFNGDGRIDLVTLDFTTSVVSVSLNTGNLTFATPINFPVGHAPADLVTADFNHDGRTDIAVVNTGDNTVSLIEANAAGTFARTTNIAVAAAPRKIIAADVNNDGLPDIIVGSDTTISVILNLGHGLFAKPAATAAIEGATEIAAGDFNADGKTDLVYGGVATKIDVALGNGNGTFAAPTVITLGVVPSALASADFNIDGNSDIAFLQPGNVLKILRNNGDDTFSSSTFSTGLTPVSLTVADFDGDGLPDIAVASQGDATVNIFNNLGSGNFAAKDDFTTAQSPNWVTSADFNGDGRPDLAFDVPFTAVPPADGPPPIIAILPNLTVPLNDNFTSGTPLVGSLATATGSNAGATKEIGEPNHATTTGGHSVWFTWVAPSSGTVTIDTFGSSFNTTLGVYTGTSVGGLATIASANDFAPGLIQPAHLNFTAVSGTVYHIAVDGANGETGALTLNISPAVAPVSGQVQTFFDSAYYLAHNPDVAAAITHGDFPNALAHFLSFGQFEGRQPSAIFNEHFYLASNPDVRAAVNAGLFKTGFQHFLARGFAEGRAGVGVAPTVTPVARNAQSFFDSEFYLAHNRDVLTAVRNGTVASAYAHFTLFGQFEGRQPSAQFNEQFYLNANPAVRLAVDAGTFQSGFQHFLDKGFTEGRAGTGFFTFTPVSGNAESFFDSAFYLAHNRDVLNAVRNHTIVSAWQHFLHFGQFEGRQPSAIFNESAYLTSNPDVGAAIAAGKFRNGFQHFVAFGFAEGRTGV